MMRKMIIGCAVMAVVLGVSVQADAATGEELFKSKACFTCHGEDGKTSLLPQYPKIAGQNPEYALQQMKDIKAGVRTNGLSAAMKAIMTMVSEEEMKILADYVGLLAP